MGYNLRKILGYSKPGGNVLDQREKPHEGSFGDRLKKAPV